MIIGSVDIKTTSQNFNRIKRKQKEIQTVRKASVNNSLSNESHIILEESESDIENNVIEDNGIDNISLNKTKDSKSTNNSKKINLKKFSRTCDRYGVSDRGAASLASALLEDIGEINENNTSGVIDKNRIRRERKNID